MTCHALVDCAGVGTSLTGMQYRPRLGSMRLIARVAYFIQG
jgi:hypothetical protein